MNTFTNEITTDAKKLIESCNICMTDYENALLIKCNKCNNDICKHCIEKMLLYQNDKLCIICPYCRNESDIINQSYQSNDILMNKAITLLKQQNQYNSELIFLRHENMTLEQYIDELESDNYELSVIYHNTIKHYEHMKQSYINVNNENILLKNKINELQQMNTAIVVNNTINNIKINLRRIITKTWTNNIKNIKREINELIDNIH